MFDHVGFGVTSLAESKGFFCEALRPLGVEVVMEDPYGVGMGRQGTTVPQVSVRTITPATTVRS